MLNVSGVDVACPSGVGVENGRKVLLNYSPTITMKMKRRSARSVHYKVSNFKRGQPRGLSHQPFVNRHDASVYLNDIASKVPFHKLVASR
jgi:hypothetical protein